MEFQENDNFCILTPLSLKLGKKDALNLIKKAVGCRKRTCFDFSMVYDCTIDFIEEIKRLSKTTDISIYNINSDLFVIFNLMNLDKYAKIFVCVSDFEENTRQLVNRHFSVV